MSVSKPTLSSVPEEIFACVLLDMPQTSYIALIRASTALYRRVTPYLYHTVWFRRRGNPHDPDYYLQRPRQTRIFDVNRFSSTMQSSALLKSYMREVSFSLGGDDFDGKAVTDELVMIVKEMTSSITALDLGLNGPPWPLNPQASILVTSLALQASNLTPDNGNLGIDRGKLLSLFTLPRLKSLTVYNICNWGNFAVDDTCQKYHSTSNITSLSLKGGSYPGREMVEVLTWPKALKYFCFQPSSWRPFVVTPLDLTTFTDALQPQKDTLEELYIFNEISCILEMVPHKPMDLKTLPMLKRVGLPRNHLVTAKRVSRLHEPARIYDSLPPNLEVLQIEIPHRNSWQAYFGVPKEGMEESPGEMSMWLGDIARMKTSLYPKLRQVLLFHDWDRTPASYQFESHPDSRDFIDEYRKANINLSHETEMENTLFEDEPAEVSRHELHYFTL